MEDHEGKLATIYQQLNDGDISVEDAMQQSNALTAEATSKKAVEQAEKNIQTILQERDAREVQDKFLKDHPDFVQLKDSGAFESIKQEAGGMHDDFSAYFAYKAEHPEEEEGPATEALKEASEPGPPLSVDEMEESMLKAMEKAGEG